MRTGNNTNCPAPQCACSASGALYFHSDLGILMENQISKTRNPVLKPNAGSISLETGFLNLFFSSMKLHKNYQMSDKINLHICLMLSVYNSFHQMVKYDHQRNHILPDLTGLEI